MSIRSHSLSRDLRRLCPDGVRVDVAMRDITRWRVGGPADFLVAPSSAEEAESLIRYLASNSIPWTVMGHFSNLLVGDEGIQAVVIHIAERMSAMKITGVRAMVQAGVWVPHFALRVGNAGLTGAEHTIGIPGTVGGLICMNGGSRRRGIGDNLIRTKCVSREGTLQELTREQCQFSYRSSLIQKHALTVLEAEFEFVPGERKEIRRDMRQTLRERRQKFPLKLPNCGSVFVSDPRMYSSHGPPGHVIEKCGLKGHRIGGAQVSPRHANFIVNTGNASARDILDLIRHVRDTVLREMNCDLSCEVRYVDRRGSTHPAHLAPEFLLGT